MIEMFADEAFVSPGDPSPRRRSELSATRPETLPRPPVPGPMNADPNGGVVSSSDPRGLPARSQNGLQHPRANQQRANKRRNTLSSGVRSPASGKRRRRANSESESVLPSNFLMGGNIFDPLNLNSLLDEEVNRALNAETPKSSPLPSKSRDPVEILIPRDITDPLNLNGCMTGGAGVILTPQKSGRRRHRNRHHGGAGRAGAGRGSEPAPTRPEQSESEPESAPRVGLDPGAPAPEPKEMESVVPAHASHRQRKRRRNNSRSENTGAPCWDKNKTAGSGPGSCHHPNTSGQPKNSQKPNNQKKKFQYGNYNQYYGYRNPGASEDSRIRILQPDWFMGKEVLDLGCNTGHLTLTIAKNWRPSRIVGLDIDGSLIHAARQNVRHYLSEIHTLQARGERSGAREGDAQVRAQPGPENDPGDGGSAAEPPEDPVQGEGPGSSNEGGVFPVSLLISRGPIAAPPLPDTPTPPPGNFPSNVTFVKGNYVLDRDSLLHTQREEFDVVLCLSVSKWVHLNWGDAGLRRFFRRVYLHLRPGGVFILEPQPWSSYSKRKNLTDSIHKNYLGIQLKPEHFPSFLTGEVGFSSYQLLGTPNSSSKGFQRPVYLFHKGAAPRK